jgi:hypothetical protein
MNNFLHTIHTRGRRRGSKSRRRDSAITLKEAEREEIK